MDAAAAAAEPAPPQDAADGAATKDGPVPEAPVPEAPVPEAPPSADDQPQQHGITDELVNMFLKRFLPADTRFVMKSYKYQPIASLGEGYTTVRKVLEVAYQDEKSGKEEVVVFVVKLASGNFTQMVREMGLYENEVIMYSQVIEHFRHILSQRGKQVVLPFPRYVYGKMVLNGEMRDDQDRLTDDQTPREMLVIELLKDFQVVDKQVGLDLEHLRLLMPAIARFHAIGLVLRQRHSEKAARLRQVKHNMPEDFDKMAPKRAPCCAVLEHLGMQAEADSLAKLCSYEHVKEAYENVFSEEQDVVTLVHGDLWSSNMMFKYDTDADGVQHPVEIRFVDLQMCRFGDLAHDLLYCLISSSRRETRRGNIREMLTWYEEAFRSQLQELGEDPDQIAPWLSLNRLVAMYSNALYNNIGIPIGTIQLLFSTDEDRADMMGGFGNGDFMETFKRLDERWRAGRCAPALQERLVGIVDDLREFGHL